MTARPPRANGDRLRDRLARDQTLLPIFTGERSHGDQLAPHELPIYYFWVGAEYFNDRAIGPELVEIETELVAHGLTLSRLFPWDYIWLYIELARDWKSRPRPGRGRGPRPGRSLIADLKHLSALIESGNVSNRLRPALANEHARLERLAGTARREDARTRRIRTSDGWVATRRHDLHYPPQWTGYIRKAASMMQAAGFSSLDTRIRLERILTLLFPFIFEPHVAHAERLRAILNTKP